MKAFKIRLSWALLAVALPTLLVAAEFPDVVDGVLTLDVSTSTTYDQALPSGVSQLIKTGTGEAILASASADFTGTVDIQAGTLTLKDVAAVGAGTKIEVTGDAATLHLNFAKPTDADDIFFAGHDVTIRGKGVKGKGAFRYTDPNNQYDVADDKMLESLTLSGDAAIGVPTRFGIGRALNLNGYVLTRVDGTGNWMWNSSDLTIGAGVISNMVGKIVWQKDPTFTEPEKARLCMEAGTLTAWVTGKLPCEVVFNGGSFDGYGETENTLSGTVTFRKNLSISQRATSHRTGFSGVVTGEGDSELSFTLSGPGTHSFNGTFTMPGSFLLNGGAASLSGDFTVGNQFRISKISGAGVFRQTAGQLHITNPNSWIAYIGESSGAYGRYIMTGGTALFAGTLVLGAQAGSTGLFGQEGGSVESTNGVVIGRNGRGFLGVTSGAQFRAVNTNTYTLPLSKLAASSGGLGALAVSGEGSTFEAGNLALGAEDGSSSTSTLAVTDGGILKAGKLYCIARTSGEAVAADVYFDGGILMPTRKDAFNNNKASPRHWEIGPKGMTIDLSELRGNSAVDEVTRETELVWSHPLSDLSGRGIASVSLPTGDKAFAAEVYLGTVLVDVEGSSEGHGAVLITECDATTRKLTGVKVLASGSGYDEATKIYVHSATNVNTRYECTYTLTDATREGGKLVKRGDRSLRLRGTYGCTGGTVVEEGVLILADEAMIPNGTPLTVKSGAALTADEKDLTVSSLAGMGGTINCKSLTVTKELELTVADIFAADAKASTVSGGLNFNEGVKVTITDPKNLAAHFYDERRTILNAEGGLSGALPVLSDKVAARWSLSIVGNTLKFGSRRGTCILVR